VAVLPARAVPVAAQVRSGARDDDVVPGAGLDVAVAAGADVALVGLVGLDVADLHGVGVVDPGTARTAARAHPRKAQSTRARATTRPAATST